ncbi:mandelate racemase [Streptomyces sp. NBC_01007]|nr:mandelate racemase [Streptomyces sp. NBC_01007]
MTPRIAADHLLGAAGDGELLHTAVDGEPFVDRVETAVYTVPTDTPEGDGTLAWDSTTMIVVQVSGGGATGLGYTYALWDLKARLLDLPLVRLLGGSRTHVPVYGSGGFTTYDQHELGRQLRGWVEEQGIPRVKIKIGESWGRAEQRDRERVAQARRSIGDAVELYVDANGAYGQKHAIRVARHLDEHGVAWFEEPVSSDDLAGLAQVRAAVAPEVTAGEHGYTLAYFGHMLGAGAVDCLQADASRCGGITVWLRAAALAEAAGLELSGHCAPHVPAHAAAAIPNLRHLEWFHDHTRIEDLFFDGTLDPQGGSVRPGADGAPGHGLTLRADQAEKYRTG